ncbi:MAG: cation transporter, partial [Vicinamibacterales bacterium]
MLQAHLEITGMTCDGCARHVERVLLGVAGVRAADVSYERGTARVTGEALHAATLTTAVHAAGYSVAVGGPTPSRGGLGAEQHPAANTPGVSTRHPPVRVA